MFITQKSLRTVSDSCGFGDPNVFILWIGIGDGREAVAMKSAYPSIKIKGIDIDEKCVTIANAKATQILGKNHNIQFVTMDGFNITSNDFQGITHVYSTAPVNVDFYEHIMKISARIQTVRSLTWMSKFFSRNGIRLKHWNSITKFNVILNGSCGTLQMWSVSMTTDMRNFILGDIVITNV